MRKFVICPECEDVVYIHEEAPAQYEMPLNNLDFRMKLELFLEVWQDIPFTDLKDRLNANNNR